MRPGGRQNIGGARFIQNGQRQDYLFSGAEHKLSMLSPETPIISMAAGITNNQERWRVTDKVLPITPRPFIALPITKGAHSLPIMEREHLMSRTRGRSAL